MFKILQYALGIVNTALGWFKSNSDQNIGRRLQQTDDLSASVKADEDAAKTRESVADLSDDALNAELRNGPQGNR